MSTLSSRQSLTGALLGGDVPAASDDPELDRLLDVAMQEITDHGFARTSLNDIARRAGVSRPTAYRRLGNKDLLIKRILVRVVATFLADFESAVEGIDDLEGRAEEAFVAGLRTARTHPFVAHLLSSDPEAILPPLSSDGAPMILMLRRSFVDFLDPGKTAPPGRAALAGEMIVRLASSFLLTPSDILDVDDDAAMRRLGRGCVQAAFAAAPESAPAKRRRR
jgi:TetR/AcrR family transcriptional repressor of uid operon